MKAEAYFKVFLSKNTISHSPPPYFYVKIQKLMSHVTNVPIVIGFSMLKT